ncbi:hypothetical protein ACFL6U_29770 [Planctomycetota bacterium]
MASRLTSIIIVLLGSTCASAKLDNRPERLEWLQDAGYGMFIHWSLDSQIGSVISHSMAGASEDYLKTRYRVSVSYRGQTSATDSARRSSARAGKVRSFHESGSTYIL